MLYPLYLAAGHKMITNYMTDITTEIKKEMQELYLNDDKAIVITYSGGKDSTLMLCLWWEMLEALPAAQRTKTLHIVMSNTKVETPIMNDYMIKALQTVQETANKNGLPIKTFDVSPDMKERYYFKVLGRGTVPPTGSVRNRWCTSSLKISPIQRVVKQIAMEHWTNGAAPLGEHDVILCMATRNEESARRRMSISKHEISKESKFSKHGEMSNVLCYLPVKFVTSDEVWIELLAYNRVFPFGVPIEDMLQHYPSGVLECGTKSGSREQGQSCGAAGSRSGCHTCLLMSGKDKMLEQLVSEGYTSYNLLQDWKDLLRSMRNDIRFRNIMNRKVLQRVLKQKTEAYSIFSIEDNAEYDYLTFQRLEEQDYMPGGFTVEARKILLEYLLYVQQQIQEELISEEEIMAILAAWKDTDGVIVMRDELKPIHYGSLGSLVFLPDCTINQKETTTSLPVFYVDINIRLPKKEVFRWVKKRQRETGKSYFFFPANYANDKTNLTWNTLRFVVCELGVYKQKDAERVIQAWLGSYPKHYLSDETMQKIITSVFVRALKKEAIFPEFVSNSTATYVAIELTNRIKRESICNNNLSKEMTSLYSRILKELVKYIDTTEESLKETS